MFRLNFNVHKKQNDYFASVVRAKQLACKMACCDEAVDGEPRHSRQGLCLR